MLYTHPFVMSSAGSVAAIAVDLAGKQSTPAYAYYGLRVNQPSFSAVAGMYNQTETVTIADITPGAAIHYTLNGTTPTASSQTYTAPIQVTSSETITAIGTLGGYQNSTVNSHSYIPPAAAPVVSPATATYYTPQTVSITSATPGAKIYYTTTYGATPTTSSALYTGPFTVNTSETVAAIAVAPNFGNSVVGSSYYGLRVNEPTFDHAGITYTGPISLAIADATPAATIYYTSNGTVPTASSIKYTGPISITSSERIEAVAILTGYQPSSVMNAYFTIH